MRAATAVAEHANHNFDRQMAKPVSAAMSHAAAINSAMRATPFGVIIWVTSGAEALIGAFLWQVFAVTYAGA
jgi:hypothetical protein